MLNFGANILFLPHNSIHLCLGCIVVVQVVKRQGNKENSYLPCLIFLSHIKIKNARHLHKQRATIINNNK